MPSRPCPCGSGLHEGRCNPDVGLAACVDCGRQFHPANNRHVRCGSIVLKTGCAYRRRLELERARKRAPREGATLAT